MTSTGRRTTVLYDGTCGFCTRGVELAVDRLPRSRDTDWQPYQAVDPTTYGLSTAEAERTLHLVEASGRIWHGAGAVGRLLVLSGGAVAVLGRRAARAAGLVARRGGLPGGDRCCGTACRAARPRWPASPRTARAPVTASSEHRGSARPAAHSGRRSPPGASARAGSASARAARRSGRTCRCRARASAGRSA